MMNRLDGLSGNKLIIDLQRLRSDLNELKNSQITSGRSGVLAYTNQSVYTWDQTVTIGSDSDTLTRTTNFDPIFTPDNSQDVPLYQWAVKAYANGTDDAHKLTRLQSWTDGTRSAKFYYGTNQGGFELGFDTYKQVTLYIKVIVYATCRGTVTVIPA